MKEMLVTAAVVRRGLALQLWSPVPSSVLALPGLNISSTNRRCDRLRA
jgi:hypothetical protein